jgi:hypothetical protein
MYKLINLPVIHITKFIRDKEQNVQKKYIVVDYYTNKKLYINFS